MFLSSVEPQIAFFTKGNVPGTCNSDFRNIEIEICFKLPNGTISEIMIVQIMMTISLSGHQFAIVFPFSHELPA